MEIGRARTRRRAIAFALLCCAIPRCRAPLPAHGGCLLGTDMTRVALACSRVGRRPLSKSGRRPNCRRGRRHRPNCRPGRHLGRRRPCRTTSKKQPPGGTRSARTVRIRRTVALLGVVTSQAARRRRCPARALLRLGALGARESAPRWRSARWRPARWRLARSSTSSRRAWASQTCSLPGGVLR